MEISGEKEIICLAKLLNSNPENKFSKNVKQAAAKFNPLNKPNKYRGKTGLVEELAGEYSNNGISREISHSTARRVVDKLEEHNCLKHVDDEKTASKPVPVYQVNKGKVREKIVESKEWKTGIEPLARDIFLKKKAI